MTSSADWNPYLVEKSFIIGNSKMQVLLLVGKVDCGSTLIQFYVRFSYVMRDQ